MGILKYTRLACILVLILAWYDYTYAACGGSAAESPAGTWTAYDATRDCVDNAISGASAGNTVIIPAGTETWSSGIIFTKQITLQGSGVANTIITAASAFNVFDSSANGTVITGIWIKAPVNAVGIKIKGDGWRIYNNKFSCITAGDRTEFVRPTGGSDDPNPTGLIDNNIIDGGKIVTIGSAQLLSEGNSEHVIWALPLDLGGSSAVYIEDNIIIASRYGNLIDGNYGGSYVARYNTITASSTGYMFEVHSMQTTNNRAVRKWEFYGNDMTGDSKYGPFFIRGGTGTVFLNKLAGSFSVNNIHMDNVRSFTDVGGTAGLCDGDSTWDGNDNAYGWPCRDQIGRGPDAVQWEDNPVGEFTQTAVPAYLWGNKKVDNTNLTTSIVNSSGNHIIADRDYYEEASSFNGTSGVGCGTIASRPATCTTGVGYWATTQSCSDLTGMVGASPSTPISGTLYKCTATDTWTSYYTPYTYPHPLRGISFTTTNFSGVSMPGGVSIR